MISRWHSRVNKRNKNYNKDKGKESKQWLLMLEMFYETLKQALNNWIKITCQPVKIATLQGYFWSFVSPYFCFRERHRLYFCFSFSKQIRIEGYFNKIMQRHVIYQKSHQTYTRRTRCKKARLWRARLYRYVNEASFTLFTLIKSRLATFMKPLNRLHHYPYLQI